MTLMLKVVFVIVPFSIIILLLLMSIPIIYHAVVFELRVSLLVILMGKIAGTTVISLPLRTLFLLSLLVLILRIVIGHALFVGVRVFII